MKHVTPWFVLLSLVAANGWASELDPVPADAPAGMIVRVSADGKREVFKANLKGVVESNQAAAEELKANIKSENKVESVAPAGELDNVSSTDSWHWSWNSYGNYGYSRGYYSYSYHCHNSYVSYYPSYNYYYGGYSYTYYYSPSYYGGYSGNGYYGYDNYGYHHSHSCGWYSTSYCR